MEYFQFVFLINNHFSILLLTKVLITSFETKKAILMTSCRNTKYNQKFEKYVANTYANAIHI